MVSDPIHALLDLLPRLTLVVGKGGVGKTTCATSLALSLAERGTTRSAGRTLLLSTDPAGTLADALGVPLGAEPAPVAGVPGLDAFRVDAESLRDAFLARWRDVLVAIVDRGTYLERDDISGIIDSALPGADEVFALLRLARLANDARWAHVVVDTAPTGHTLRLLALPRTFDALVVLLDAMQEKHRFMVRALTHRYRADDADAFLAEMRAEVGALRATLTDPSRAAAVIVTRDEPVVAAETARLRAALAELGITVAAEIVNAVDDDAAIAPRDAHAPIFIVPRLAESPRGLDGLSAWAGASACSRPSALGSRLPLMAESRGPRTESDQNTRVHRSAPSGRPTALVRPLTIVGGKGGVGKTTVACALAIATATSDRPTLLVSTDPAPSVGDALGFAIGDAETPVPGAPGLAARQMDAAAAFERLRASYQARVDELFDGFVARGIDAAHDRAVLRELLALAPPGVDEVYALAALGSTLAEGRWSRVIVDPAPTGHLLRLLEMPALALEWSHRLMRLILEYREVISLGDAAAELLAFARRTRALDALLRDPHRAGLLVVALDEPLVRAESARLARAARERGVDVIALMWNRAAGAAPRALDLPDDATPVQLTAPLRDGGPTGVAELRRWADEWSLGAPS